MFQEIVEGGVIFAGGGGHVAADEVEAVDVVAVDEFGDIGFVFSFGEGVRLAGDGLPAEDEVEVGIFGVVWILFVDIEFEERHLCVEEGGFDGGEADLTPFNGGELVDEGLFDVVERAVGGAVAVEVGMERGDVFDGEDDVDGGGEAVFEGVGGGAGFAFGGGGAFGFGSVDAGLLGAGEFFGVGHGGSAFRLRG